MEALILSLLLSCGLLHLRWRLNLHLQRWVFPERPLKDPLWMNWSAFLQKTQGIDKKRQGKAKGRQCLVNKAFRRLAQGEWRDFPNNEELAEKRSFLNYQILRTAFQHGALFFDTTAIQERVFFLTLRFISTTDHIL